MLLKINFFTKITPALLETFFETQFNLSNIVSHAFRIGKKRTLTLVRLTDLHAKSQIMQIKKSVLAESNIFIDHNLTFQERQIKSQLISLAKDLKKTVQTKLLSNKKG